MSDCRYYYWLDWNKASTCTFYQSLQRCSRIFNCSSLWVVHCSLFHLRLLVSHEETAYIHICPSTDDVVSRFMKKIWNIYVSRNFYTFMRCSKAFQKRLVSSRIFHKFLESSRTFNKFLWFFRKFRNCSQTDLYANLITYYIYCIYDTLWSSRTVRTNT